MTWKPDHELYSTHATFDLTNPELDNDDDDDFYEDEQMSVPLLVTVFVIPLYLTLGAILFNIWGELGLSELVLLLLHHVDNDRLR